jgi:PIN domain nuclease of toxin-antitoxin system
VIYVLDTHALVWHLTDSKRLGSEARAVLVDDDSVLVIPGIALAEIQFLSLRSRISVSLETVLSLVGEDARCFIIAPDEQVAKLIPAGLNINDAAVVATALYIKAATNQEVRLISTDREIKDSGSLQTVW